MAWTLVVALLTATAVPRPVRLPVGGVRTVRLLGGASPESGRLLPRIEVNIAGAVDAVEAFWGRDWAREIVIVVADSDRQFVALSGGPVGGGGEGTWADIAAVAVADRLDFARRVAVGQRIVFAPGAAQMGEPALRIVLTHELFHYAARADTALDAPRWLIEGVADFVARPHEAIAGVSLPKTLPSDADLDTPGAQRSLGYDGAWWFASFVADRFGAATLRQLYRSACGVGHAELATALRDVLGVDAAGVLALWQQWLTRHRVDRSWPA